MKTYKVHVERDGRFWLVQVPAVKRATQARNLGEVEEMARDLIAIMADVEPDTFDLDVQIDAPGDARALLDAAVTQRDLATRANATAAMSTRAAVLVLLNAAVSQRDIADLLGVSVQRANQLAKDVAAEDLRDAVAGLETAIAALEADAARATAAANRKSAHMLKVASKKAAAKKHGATKPIGAKKKPARPVAAG